MTTSARRDLDDRADGNGDRFGATLRNLMNGLKRTEALAAIELDLEPHEISLALSGEPAARARLVERAVRAWPVNERDFAPIHDDAPSGVRVMRALESQASNREMLRGGLPYFNYRDTVMSRCCAVRPEWVEMLVEVENSDPENKNVRWNLGHFLYQVTYFVGRVNFYYEDAGIRKCVEMQTGDTAFCPAYVPHSFTRRPGSGPAYILALTFGGRLLGDAQQELAVLPERAIDRMVSGPRSGAPLRRWLEDLSLDAAALAALSGVAEADIAAAMEGAPLSEDGASRLAETLGVPRSDLQSEMVEPRVLIRRHAEARRWRLGDGTAEFVELASSPVAKFARGLEVTLPPGPQAGQAMFDTRLHTYIYNVGETPLSMTYDGETGETSASLEPGASAYVKPFVPHGLHASGPQGGPAGKALILRVPGQFVGDTEHEAVTCGRDVLLRLVSESKAWF